MKSKILVLIGAVCLFLASCKEDSKPLVITDKRAKIQKENKDTQVFVHFMVWYETPESTGNVWGSHWAWSQASPPTYDATTGEWSKIKSNYVPLTGPYASSDRNILEYQLLLLKYAGIDGVIPDWYGVEDRGKSEDKTRSLEALWSMVKEVGLKMAVCYEDQYKSTDLNTAIASIQTDMKYLEDNYFVNDDYLKINGAPALLIFGPQRVKAAYDWTTCFSVLSQEPSFIPLVAHGLLNKAYGFFNWPFNTPWQSQYTTTVKVPFIYPGWDDIYDDSRASANDQKNHRTDVNYENGEFLSRQIELARTKKPEYLQLSAWNDYGEGNIFEPTVEFGYTFLNVVQEKLTGVDPSYNAKEVFPQIKRYYDLKIANNKIQDEEVKKQLEKAFLYFCALKPSDAISILDKLDPK